MKKISENDSTLDDLERNMCGDAEKHAKSLRSQRRIWLRRPFEIKEELLFTPILGFCQDQDPIAIAYQAKKIHEDCVLVFIFVKSV